MVLARYQSGQLQHDLEGKLEGWLGLELNREKTRVIDVRQGSLDFLGYSFRYVNSRLYPGTRVLSMRPSKKAVQRQKQALRELVGRKTCTVPVTDLIQSVNRQLRGWGNYFGHGFWRDAYHEVNEHVLRRFRTHLRNRSQRAYGLPPGCTLYRHLQQLGLVFLRQPVSAT